MTKGLYTYGEKEIWYVHSIETKNMVATFTISERHDAHGVKYLHDLQNPSENGGINTGVNQRKLDRIDLYTKAEFMKDPSIRKPLKTVHFSYTYELCGLTPDNDGLADQVNDNSNKGKLTLKSIWFTYNGNEAQKKNRYRFDYSNHNFPYNTVKYDKWGTYKDPDVSNPVPGMSNIDSPYTIQNPTLASQANANASAWNLEKILLPSGSMITVNYESDDYAYVQSKTACQMTKIAGFGYHSTDADDANAPSANLYDFMINETTNPEVMDRDFVFFDVDEAIPANLMGSSAAVPAADYIRQKYFADMKQILMKIWVKMPDDSYGGGYEPINVYANFGDCGVSLGHNKRIWIHLLDRPIMETVFQFAKDLLPSKVYPGYDDGNTSGIRQIVNAIHGLASNFAQAITGFKYNLKSLNKCREVDLSYSYARLNNPFRKKIGGGHRVKSVIITDNWNKMLHPQDNSPEQILSSSYGQEYDYTKKEMVCGVETTISSGVATYEPSVGNEENPFKEILQYSDRQPLGPTNHENVELPVTEAFFPTPFIGYSKVTVTSINKKTAAKKIKSGVGKQVTEYWTSREYPVITDYTDFDDKSRKRHKPSPLTSILFDYSRDYLTLSQGFRVILNDMNGKIKSQLSYPEDKPNAGPDEFINATYYNYKKINVSDSTFLPDNKVDVIDGPQGIVTSKLIGRDVEIMNDFREHSSKTTSVQIPANLNGFFAGPFYVTLFNILHLAYRHETMFRSATTLKVINEYGILDNVVNIDKGSQVSATNLVFDSETGEPLIKRTNNEFNKPVYNLNYPAHWVNSGMDLAYKNIGIAYSGVTFRDGRIINIPGGTIVDMSKFESGDEIYVEAGDADMPGGDNGCSGFSNPVYPQSNESLIWAIDISKDEDNIGHNFIFLDRDGVPFNAFEASIKIIRSGKRNFVNTSVGSIVSLSDPCTVINGVRRIYITNQANVINAAAAEFKEKWKVQEAFHKVHSTATINRYTPIHNVVLKADASQSMNFFNGNCPAIWPLTPACADILETVSNTPYYPTYFLARVHNVQGQSYIHDQAHRSFLRFSAIPVGETNPLNIPVGSRILDARLNLHSHSEDPATHHFYVPDPSGSGYDGSHQHGFPHISANNANNAFFISKMTAPWPTTQSGWETEWYADPTFNAQSFGDGTTDPIKDYIDGPDGNFAVPVTTTFSAMLSAYRSYGYLPGIKIQLRHNPPGVGTEAEVCFDAARVIGARGSKIPGQTSQNLLNTPLPQLPPGYEWDPKINIKYSNCAEAHPVGYIPAPHEELDVCTTYETGDFCESQFAKILVNPYVLGILGNWQPWRSYVYYGARKESDPTTATDLAKNGVIENFETFWSLATAPGNYMTKSNSSKWVWNAETIQTNRKGAETENHDPLGRYNSGIYGYQETLPVAVANNARKREIAYDGFEDYDYNDQQCAPFCSPYQRHMPLALVESKITTEAHHTGTKSLKVEHSDAFIFESPITANNENFTPVVDIQMTNNSYNATSVSLTGTGLTAKFYSNESLSGAYQTISPSLPYMFFAADATGACISGWGSAHPTTGCAHVSAEWNGSIVAQFTGDYAFSLAPGSATFADDQADAWVAGNLVAHSEAPSTNTTNTFHMTAGQAYTIKVTYKQSTLSGSMQLRWKRVGVSAVFAPVPSANLYPVGSTIPAPVTYLSDCSVPQRVRVTGIGSFVDKFSVIPGSKYIFSAWVREGLGDCLCTGYNNNSIQVYADDIAIDINGVPLQTDALPAGPVIEGWQRYEFSVTIPIGRTMLKVLLRNTSDDLNKKVYFDDLRIFPYNGNLKSFVYNPVNLRLTAELDENNYASFYEYDDEGTLVRVKKETIKGVKTITETRSALQKNITDF